MPPTDHQGSFLNLISIRRNQIPPIESDQEHENIELLQKHVADRFSDLLPQQIQQQNSSSDPCPLHSPAPLHASYPLFSIAWYRKLLDAFLCCESEFKAVLLIDRDPSQLSKPPLDRLLPELLERALKALDICSSISHGIELLLHWQKLAQIAVSALEQRPVGDGQVRRAKKALSTLLAWMAFDDKESHGKTTERSWSFGRRGNAAAANNIKDRNSGGNFRSLSWSMAKSWSAAKQIQAMSSNLVAPRGGETNGLALPIYMMSTILVFVMWALVAGIPCQERNGLCTHFQVPRQLSWAQTMVSLQEKIGEEWKKKEKKATAGLLEELKRMEKVAQGLIDFAESFHYPMEEEKVEEMAAQVAELADICQKMEEGLVPLQQQVREVFHRIVRSRVEVLDLLDQGGKLSAASLY